MSLKLVILVVCVSFVLGQDPKKWTVAELADPITDASGCGNTKTGFVCNPDKVLTEDEVTQINQTIVDIISETSCLCAKGCYPDRDGSVPSVIVVKAIDGLQDTADNTAATMKTFSGDLRKKWAFGDCDNDLTILVVTDRKFIAATFDKVWTSTGEVVKIPVSNECVAAITVEDKPLFADNAKLGPAILSLLGKLRTSLKNSACAVSVYKNKPSDVKNASNNNTDTPTVEDMPAFFKRNEMILIIVGVIIVVIFFATCLGCVCYMNKRQSRKRRKYMAAQPQEENL